jgi:diguanylate cyclase (GGDEF)-like protein
MSENKVILTLNLSQKLQKKFEKAIDVQEYDCIHWENLQDDKRVKFETIFIYVENDLSKFEHLVHEIHNHYPNVPVILIMGKRNFDVLMSAFYTSIHHVIVAPFDQMDVEQALIKSSLLNQRKKHDPQIPVSELLQLFSSPIKLNDDGVIYSYLNDYFHQFEETNSFALYYQTGKIKKIEGQCSVDDNKIQEYISSYHSKEKIVGTLHIEKNANGELVLFPIYQTEDYTGWGVLELNSEAAKKIVNSYVMNFLMGIFHYRRNKNKVEDLTHLANTDEITGLYNQRKLTEDLEAAIIEHEKLHGTFSLMFIDIDHFKFVNDNFGHVIGSDMLVQMGRAIKLLLRGSDHVYRYGGDEFVVMMPKVETEIVHKIAMRILNKIKSMVFDVGEGKNHQLSVSIGICEYPTDAKSAKEIIQFADDMMYLSKESGRGKVFHLKEVGDAATGS